MKVRSFVLAFSFGIITTVSATVFFPMPIDKQVEEASAGAEVILNNTHVFKSTSNLIMTEYHFKVAESYSLSRDDLDNNELVLTLPGGSFEGRTSVIDGAPEFKLGEKVFLLLKKIESKIYLSNFSLGKYKIQDIGGKTYYVSEVFPLNPNMGRISKDKMIEIMLEKWKVSQFTKTPGESKLKISEVEGDKEFHPTGLARLEERSPAQVLTPNDEPPLFFWGAFGVLISFFVMFFVKVGNHPSASKSE